MAFLFTIVIIFTGASVGSFAAVVLERFPEESFISPPSRCSSCGIRIPWYAKIPLISYPLLGGKCKNCRAPIPVSLYVAEVSMAMIYLLIWLAPLPNITKIRLFFFVPLATMISAIDLKLGIIPDFLNLSGIIIGFTIAAFFGFDVFIESVEGALFAVLFMGLLHYITGGRGIGFGDVKFSAVSGSFTGLHGCIMFLKLSFFSGAIIGIFLMFVGIKSMKSRLPFGPMLAFGGIVGILSAGMALKFVIQWPFNIIP